MLAKRTATLLGTAAIVLALGVFGAAGSVSAGEAKCKATGKNMGFDDVSFNFEWRSRPRTDVEVQARPGQRVNIYSTAMVSANDVPVFSCNFKVPKDANGVSLTNADLVCEARSTASQDDLSGATIDVDVSGGGLGTETIQMSGTCN